MRRPLRIWAALALAAAPARAQDSTAAVPAAAAPESAAVAARADTLAAIRAPVSPMGAFWRSLLIPGWGQAKTGRRTAAAIFLGFEGVALGMTLTTSSQLNHMKETGSGSVESKSQQREDWLVLLGVNHLLSAMEAYVSAHLWDFPGDLSVQAAPGGGVAGGVSLPMRIR